MEHDNVDHQVSITLPDYETPANDSDAESPINFRNPDQFKEFTRIGLEKLDESKGNDHEYEVIKRSFLLGMGFLGEEINVVAVHKNSYSSVTGLAKMEAFRVFSSATAAARGGDGNIKFGWYGGCRDEICNIVGYGFGGCGEFEKVGSRGIGVHLSPLNVPIESAVRAKEDENGLRHILLCRVILGNTETIPVGSEQSKPSSSHFDSGIDNPLAPTKYIIWHPYMNSHIFPNYLISFTAPLTGVTWNFFKKPNSPSMKFSVLLNVLSRFLQPSKMGLILNYYNDFRESKIGRSQLIKRLRNLVGDKMLISVIKLYKDEVK